MSSARPCLVRSFRSSVIFVMSAAVAACPWGAIGSDRSKEGLVRRVRSKSEAKAPPALLLTAPSSPTGRWAAVPPSFNSKPLWPRAPWPLCWRRRAMNSPRTLRGRRLTRPRFAGRGAALAEIENERRRNLMRKAIPRLMTSPEQTKLSDVRSFYCCTPMTSPLQTELSDVRSFYCFMLMTSNLAQRGDHY